LLLQMQLEVRVLYSVSLLDTVSDETQSKLTVEQLFSWTALPQRMGQVLVSERHHEAMTRGLN
jgi:hypothetical protein